VEVVTNLYHTSSSAIPVQGATGIPELVAFCTVPAVFTQLVLDVSNTAFAQLLFTGCAIAVKQKNKQHAVKNKKLMILDPGKSFFIVKDFQIHNSDLPI